MLNNLVDSYLNKEVRTIDYGIRISPQNKWMFWSTYNSSEIQSRSTFFHYRGSQRRHSIILIQYRARRYCIQQWRFLDYFKKIKLLNLQQNCFNYHYKQILIKINFWLIKISNQIYSIWKNHDQIVPFFKKLTNIESTLESVEHEFQYCSPKLAKSKKKITKNRFE